MSISPRLAFDVCHEVYKSIHADGEAIPLIDPTKVPSDHLWRSHKAPTGQEFAADFAIACKRALQGPENASRLILCNYYYLQLMEYEKCRRYMGIGEMTWVKWTEDIRDKAGKVILAKGLFPPRAYFGERSRPRRDAKVIHLGPPIEQMSAA